MKGDQYKIVQLPDARCDTGCFFTTQAFNAYQMAVQGKKLLSFGIIRAETEKLCASLTLAGKDNSWIVPVTGAFGGLTLHERHVPAAWIDKLLSTVTEKLKTEGAASCVMRLPPGCFNDDGAPLLANALFRAGWRLEQLELNYHLPITVPETFLACLDSKKRQELRRFQRTGAICEMMPARAEDIYRLIARNREAMNYPLTMTWEAVAQLAAAFPDNVIFFGVTRGGQLLAGAITLQVRPDYLYVFYWGEDPDYRKESPVSLLAEGLMNYAHANKMAVLDIGTSTEYSAPNEGLIFFKRSLGCSVTTKPVYRLDFDR